MERLVIMQEDNILQKRLRGERLPDKYAYKLEEMLSYAEHYLSQQQPPQGLWATDEEEIEKLYEELGIKTFHPEHREYVIGMDKPHYHNAYAICIELKNAGYDVTEFTDKIIELYPAWKALYQLNKEGNKNDI